MNRRHWPPPNFLLPQKFMDREKAQYKPRRFTHVNNSLRTITSSPGHCVIDPKLATPEGLKSREAFIGDFPEDGPYYLEHLEAAVNLAAQSPDIIFSPSGGKTHLAAGRLSEGGTNATAAKAMNYWGHPEVEART